MGGGEGRDSLAAAERPDHWRTQNFILRERVNDLPCHTARYEMERTSEPTETNNTKKNQIVSSFHYFVLTAAAKRDSTKKTKTEKEN